jgi:uncharacterized protein (TIGR00304 family)
MSRLRLIALLLFVAGAVGIVAGVLSGDIQVGLIFFVIPYLYGGTALGALAILLVMAGVVLVFVDMARRTPSGHATTPTDENPVRPRTEWGGVIIVGPVPIVFGSSPRITLVALAIVAAILTALLFLFLFVR